jgi:hypothetical protein
MKGHHAWLIYGIPVVFYCDDVSFLICNAPWNYCPNCGVSVDASKTE